MRTNTVDLFCYWPDSKYIERRAYKLMTNTIPAAVVDDNTALIKQLNLCLEHLPALLRFPAGGSDRQVRAKIKGLSYTISIVNGVVTDIHVWKVVYDGIPSAFVRTIKKYSIYADATDLVNAWINNNTSCLKDKLWIEDNKIARVSPNYLLRVNGYNTPEGYLITNIQEVFVSLPLDWQESDPILLDYVNSITTL